MTSKRIKVLSTLAALGFSVSLLSPYATVYAAGNSQSSVQAGKRLKGNDRYLTSVEVSKEGWKDGAESVVIASGEDFADALCAGPLAKKFNAPILLTGKNTISSSVLSELKRLKAKQVFIVGGEGAVSKQVVSSIQKANTAIKLERLSGKDRYATSVKVAEKIGTDKIVVTTGKGYADALSMASIAAEEGMSILLTEKAQLPQSVKDFVKGKTLGKTFIIGGTGVVSADVEKQLVNVERLGGVNRYETNQKVLEAFSSRVDFKKVYMTIGGPGEKDFADALATSALAAKTFSPIIIVDKKANVSSYTKALAEENMLPGTEVITIGGEKILPETKANSIKISATSFNEEGKTVGSQDKMKPETLAGNITVRGNKITLQNCNISKNLYVEANGGIIKDVKVQGTLVIHSGTILENVQAERIKILSDGNESINLKDTKVNLVEVKSRNEVRVVFEGTTEVKETKVNSAAIIEVQAGAKAGKVVIDKTMGNEVVTLKGAIQEVVVQDNIKQLALADNTIIGRIVAGEDVEVKTGSNVEIKQIQAAIGVDVKPADNTIKLPNVDPIDNTIPPVVVPGGTGGGAGGGVITPTPIDAFKTLTIEQAFNVLKNPQDENYNNIKKLFINTFAIISAEKQTKIKELGATSCNSLDIKQAVFGNKFGIKDIEKKTDIDILREMLDKVKTYESVDKFIADIKTINNIPNAQINIKGVNGAETTYYASKIEVKVGEKEIYSTSTLTDGVQKNAQDEKAVFVNYDELISKANQELFGDANKSLKTITLNDVLTKGDKWTVQVTFKSLDGQTKTVEYTFNLSDALK